jgi:hypothetical protein
MRAGWRGKKNVRPIHELFPTRPVLPVHTTPTPALSPHFPHTLPHLHWDGDLAPDDGHTSETQQHREDTVGGRSHHTLVAPHQPSPGVPSHARGDPGVCVCVCVCVRKGSLGTVLGWWVGRESLATSISFKIPPPETPSDPPLPSPLPLHPPGRVVIQGAGLDDVLELKAIQHGVLVLRPGALIV